MKSLKNTRQTIPKNKNEKLNIYLFNKLKSTSLDLTKDESYLMARLINLENKLSTGEIPLSSFASEINKCIAEAGARFDLCRVCIAIATPFSQRLNAISVFSSADISEDTMRPGYNCFVAQDSSLFKINEGEVRICGDLNQVVERFNTEEKPVQRSLGRLHAMGINSSFTIASSIGKIGKGFLFLNSKKIDHFSKFQNSDYILSCTLKLLLTSALHRYFSGMLNFDSKLADQIGDESDPHSVIDKELFKDKLTDFLRNKGAGSVDAKVSTNIQDSYFLALRAAFYLIYETASRHYNLQKTGILNVELLKSDTSTLLEIRVSTEATLNPQNLAELENLAPIFGMQLKYLESHFQLTTELQNSSSAENQLSTALDKSDEIRTD